MEAPAAAVAGEKTAAAVVVAFDAPATGSQLRGDSSVPAYCWGDIADRALAK